MDSDEITAMLLILFNAEKNKLVKYFRDNIDYLSEISKIFIEKTRFIIQELEIENNLTSQEIIDLARNFLKSINKDYLNKFNESLNNGTINLYDAEDDNNKMDFGLEAFLDIDKSGKRNINIPLEYNLFDLNKLIHEFIHSVTLNYENEESFDQLLLSESIPILYEFLIFNFLIDKNISHNDNLYIINWRLSSLIDMAEDICYLTSLYKETI